MNTDHFFLLLSISWTFLYFPAYGENLADSPARPHTALDASSTNPSSDAAPSVLLVMLVRNKAFALPHFLAFIDLLDYPKDRISLFIRSDHNVDNTTGLLKEWLQNVIHFYDVVDFSLEDAKRGYEDETSLQDWPEERFETLMNLKEEALAFCKKTKKDYVFYVDADILLTNSKVLKILMRHEKTLIAPCLVSYDFYHNFWWGEMDDDYYTSLNPGKVYRGIYLKDLFFRKKTEVVQVSNLHSTFLIDMRHKQSHLISFVINPRSYHGPYDDIFIFGFNNRMNGIEMWLTNEEDFGTLPNPPDSEISYEDIVHQFNMITIKRLHENPPMPISKHITVPKLDKKKKDKLGFDEIYVINLERRHKRREAMEYNLELMGIEATFFNAVDGKSFTNEDIDKLGIKVAPSYYNPVTGKGMKAGEVGCFLSHYRIWEDVLMKGHKNVLIMEDDVVFEPKFRRSLTEMMQELNDTGTYWELIYLERWRWSHQNEIKVVNTKHLVRSGWSVLAISYVLSHTGAKKLYEQQPLSKMVPVDIFLPIMYDKYGNRHNDHNIKETQALRDSKKDFYPRDLVALALETNHTVLRQYQEEVDVHHISDTEVPGTLDFLPPLAKPTWPIRENELSP